MTEPLGTDALRAFAAESGGSVASLTVWGMTSATLHRTAADEIDRLRKVIEDAPHEEWCNAWPCTCWKFEAL